MNGPLEPDAYKAHMPPHMDEMDKQAALIMTSFAISFRRLADEFADYNKHVKAYTREGGMS